MIPWPLGLQHQHHKGGHQFQLPENETKYTIRWRYELVLTECIVKIICYITWTTSLHLIKFHLLISRFQFFTLKNLFPVIQHKYTHLDSRICGFTWGFKERVEHRIKCHSKCTVYYMSCKYKHARIKHQQWNDAKQTKTSKTNEAVRSMPTDHQT